MMWNVGSIFGWYVVGWYCIGVVGCVGGGV